MLLLTGVRDFSGRSSASRARPNCVLQRDHRSRLLCNRMWPSRLPWHGRIRQAVLWNSSSLWGWFTGPAFVREKKAKETMRFYVNLALASWRVEANPFKRFHHRIAPKRRWSSANV